MWFEKYSSLRQQGNSATRSQNASSIHNNKCEAFPLLPTPNLGGLGDDYFCHHFVVLENSNLSKANVDECMTLHVHFGCMSNQPQWMCVAAEKKKTTAVIDGKQNDDRTKKQQHIRPAQTAATAVCDTPPNLWLIGASPEAVCVRACVRVLWRRMQRLLSASSHTL